MNSKTDKQPAVEETRLPTNDDSEKEAKIKRKTPGLEDPYEHAPKREGDPWEIILKPEMEKDKIQCDAWKEEVQTLLIFAGLFSAVVTAFVIESYKFLQPDPNDTIIILLTQIANGPNINSSSSLSTSGTTAVATSFAPSAPSIRINVFWFISLILSLATVLVGTIALQWLREHQAYPGLSPKQTLALIRVRSEALQAWYVPQIFAVLPLLLQGALVLFFAGLIDFTLPLGRKLWIPIVCTIGIILLFLAVTTILPAFQPLLLSSGHFCRDTIPTPCAYKSPQSQVFRTFCGFLLYSLSFVFPKVYIRDGPDRADAYRLLSDHRRHLFPHIYTIWHRTSWPTFDLEWLSLRDAWHNRILDKDRNLYHYRREWEDTFPLSDIIQCLIKVATEPSSAKHTEEFLAATCYCFQELSESTWKFSEHDKIVTVERRNYYFEQLYRPTLNISSLSMSNLVLNGGEYYFRETYSSAYLYIPQHSTIFCQDQTHVFRARILDKHRAPVLQHYHREVWLRMMHYILQSTFQHHSGGITAPLSVFTFCPDNLHEVNISSWADLLATVVEGVSSCSTRVFDLRRVNPLYIHPGTPFLLNSMASEIRKLFLSPSDNYDIHEIDGFEKCGSIFRLAANYLNNEPVTYGPWDSGELPMPPSILFYHMAIILKSLLENIPYADIITFQTNKSTTGFSQGLATLFDALVKRKKAADGLPNNEAMEHWVFDIGIMEDTYRGRENGYMPLTTFSGEWWALLLHDYAVCYGLDDIDPEILQTFASKSNRPYLPLRISRSESLPTNPERTTTNATSLSSHASIPDAPFISNTDEHSVSRSSSPELISEDPVDLRPSLTFPDIVNEPATETPSQVVAPQRPSSPSPVSSSDAARENLRSGDDSVVDVQKNGTHRATAPEQRYSIHTAAADALENSVEI